LLFAIPAHSRGQKPPLEIGLVILIYMVGRWVWRTHVALGMATWYAVPEESHLRLTLPGYWYAWIQLAALFNLCNGPKRNSLRAGSI
jgi:hypothetical protein